MSTTTNFSGPWHVITDSQGYDNIHHAPADYGDTGDIVATCFQDSDHARLIAAAPELYGALTGLEGILATAESNASGNPEWEYVSKRISAARAALSKARGEA